MFIQCQFTQVFVFSLHHFKAINTINMRFYNRYIRSQKYFTSMTILFIIIIIILLSPNGDVSFHLLLQRKLGSY